MIMKIAFVYDTVYPWVKVELRRGLRLTGL